MRISDWSSDVCSSDLFSERRCAGSSPPAGLPATADEEVASFLGEEALAAGHLRQHEGAADVYFHHHRPSVRQRDVERLVAHRREQPREGIVHPPHLLPVRQPGADELLARRRVMLKLFHAGRSAEETCEIQSLMRIYDAVFCWK